MTLEEWDRQLSGLSLEDYDREVRRRMRRRWLRAAGEVVGGVLTLALIALLFWLFLAATPDQSSAECEALRAEILRDGRFYGNDDDLANDVAHRFYRSVAKFADGRTDFFGHPITFKIEDGRSCGCTAEILCIGVGP